MTPDLLKIAWLAPLIMAWNQIRGFATRLTGVLIVRTLVRDHAVSSRLLFHLLNHGRWITSGKRIFASCGAPRLDGRWEEILLSVPDSKSLVLLNGRPAWCMVEEGFITLVSIRGCFPAQRLVKEAAMSNPHRITGGCDSPKGTGFVVVTRGIRVCRDHGLGRSANTVEGERPPGSPIDPPLSSSSSHEIVEMLFRTVSPWKALPVVVDNPEELGVSESVACEYWWPEGMKVVRDEVGAWLRHASWFAERRVPHRRGVAFLGEPGTGKSAVIANIAKFFDLPVLIIDLAGCDNEGLRRLIAEIGVPMVVVFEDIDSVFHGRENITTGDFEKVSFDGLLNVMSGISNQKSIFWCVTSNHPEYLDPALLRPGRIDRCVTVKRLPEEGQRFLANKILDRWPDLIERALQQTWSKELPTAAEFENWCIQAALERFWEENGKGVAAA